MAAALSEAIAGAGLALADLELVEAYAGSGGELDPLVSEAGEWVAWGAVPVPPDVGCFVAPPFYRPPGSFRAFYYRPSGGGAPAPRPPRGVLAFKGLEPAAEGFDRRVTDMLRPAASPHTVAEHFVFEEGKIPGCLGLAEALGEARAAATAQAAHLRAYGGRARLPLPLAVFRHPPQVADRVAEVLEHRLSSGAYRLVKRQLADGLGVYVYHYPVHPTRAQDVDLLLAGLGRRARLLRLIALCDPEVVVARWAATFVRLLYLGMLPGSLRSFRTGLCCQPHNACIDGGFVDVGSLTPVSALPDDAAVHAALQFSADSLFDSARALVLGSGPARRPEDVRADLHHLRRWLGRLVDEALAGEARPGLALDGRVADYFTAATSFEELLARLRACSPPPGNGFVHVADGWAEFGMALIEEARDAGADGS